MNPTAKKNQGDVVVSAGLFQSVGIFLVRNRTDIGINLALIIVAAVLRFWRLADLGLTHFDEGSYAMTGRWLATLGNEGWIYQSGHAPGLFPTLVGLFFAIFGIKDCVAISVSALAGSLTVGLIYWIGVKWLDRAAGAMAALFLATAEYHLMYSRLALTDATFTLLFWASLACLFRGITVNDRRWFMLGGLMAGLCWNTKYHGFFPLLLAGAWLLLQVFPRLFCQRKPLFDRALWRNFGLAFGIACLVYLPWFLFVQISAGYGAILQGQMAHSIGQGSVIVTPPRTHCFYLTQWLSPGLLISAVLGIVAALFCRERNAMFLLISASLFAIATMFYMSFPRLLLPLIPALCLLSGYGVWTISHFSRWRPEVLMAAFAVLILAANSAGAQKVLALRTDGYRQGADYLQKANAPTFTQMSKNYYFYEKERSLELRWQEPAALDSMAQHCPAVLIAVDPIFRRFPLVETWFEKYRARMQLVHEIPLQMYEPLYYQGFDPTQLDQLPPSLAPFRPGQAKIEIYQLKNQREQK